MRVAVDLEACDWASDLPELDPMVSIPTHEVWLFKNKRAAKLVQEGLEDAKQRRLVKAKEDFSKYVRSDD